MPQLLEWQREREREGVHVRERTRKNPDDKYQQECRETGILYIVEEICNGIATLETAQRFHIFKHMSTM